MQDSLGNALVLQEAASLAPVNDFVEGFISCESRAVNVLAAAESDHSTAVQAYCAALHMFCETKDGPANALPFLERAQAALPHANARERRFCAAVAAWIAGDIPGAIRLHEEQARQFPRDLASLKLGQYHLFNTGDASGMLRLALEALPAAGDVPYLHGMAAFGWEQCHLLEQAEAAARTAIAMCRKEPWAHHALAHVMLTEGRIHEGREFLRGVSDTWTGLNSFMVTHNWWHAALFALELGDHAEVLRMYDEQVWGVVKEYPQDQINAVSLLARLEFSGVDVGARWQELSAWLAPHTDDHVLPFLDMQYLYGLARAGRPEAGTLMRNIEAHARQVPAHARHAWQRVCVPASRGLLAHAEGRYAEAVEQLGTALPRLMEIGGSHAQRDLFEQVHLDALMKSGQWSAAQQAVQMRLRAHPGSLRLRAQARRVYSALGLASLL